eukprot:Selendium_serpulae@DN2298_c0_g1_i1.p1
MTPGISFARNRTPVYLNLIKPHKDDPSKIGRLNAATIVIDHALCGGEPPRDAYLFNDSVGKHNEVGLDLQAKTILRQKEPYMDFSADDFGTDQDVKLVYFCKDSPDVDDFTELKMYLGNEEEQFATVHELMDSLVAHAESTVTA